MLAGTTKKSKVGIIVGVVGGIFVLLFGGLLFFLYKRRQKDYKGDVFVDIEGYYYRLITFICE